MVNIKTSEIKKILKDNLGDNRYNHSVEVAKSAVKLAKKYGADTDKAEIAGLLHDVMKEKEPDEQLKVIIKGDIELNKIELEMKKLWHQISGMVFVRDELGIDDIDILNAIRYHTSGRANMTLLEKVVFIADYISDDRDYNGVKDMRKLADKSLDEAMVQGLSFTIMELAEEKRLIVGDSIDAYNMAIFETRKEY